MPMLRAATVLSVLFMRSPFIETLAKFVLSALSETSMDVSTLWPLARLSFCRRSHFHRY